MSPTRRDFLKTALGSTAVLSVGASAPRFLLDAAAAEADTKKETVLVVVQLSGGNDGLNTVVPFKDEDYRKHRPTLAIPADEVLKINDSFGFHPSARGLADLLEENKLAIAQGVGYANPNRSHFESMDIWHTCQRKGKPRPDGWIGRYLDAAHKRAGGDAPALHLGRGKQPLALAAQDVRTPSISSLDRFRLDDGGNEKLRATISELTSSKRTKGGGLLDFIQTSTSSALAASRRVEEALKGYDTPVEYPDTQLAKEMKTVAQLIDAGLSTRVYYLAIDGFDTHSPQAAAHAGLLNQFSGAVSAFIKDVAHHGHGDRVLVMSFSEFGRRVKENASEGTDHGAAAPMFLAGGKVKPGLIGKHPSMTDLVDGDVKHHTDFRQVYAAVLEQWLGWSSGKVLAGEYQPIEIVNG